MSNRDSYRRGLVSVLCLIALLGALNLPRAEEVETYLTQAASLIQQGNYGTAVEVLEEALKLDPSSGPAHLLLGDALRGESERAFQRAMRAYLESTKFEETAYAAHKRLGRLYLDRGLFEEAVEYYSATIGQAPEDVEALKGLGIAYYKAGKSTEGLEVLEKVDKLSPDDPEVVYTIGIISQEKNLFEEAVARFRKVIQLTPESKLASDADARIIAIQTEGKKLTVDDIEDPEIREIIKAAPEADEYPNAGAIVLLDEGSYYIHPDNTMTKYIHVIAKVFNDRGKRRFGEIYLGYDSTYETMKIEYARTIKPDGTLVTVGEKAMREVTPWAQYPLYSNVKTKIISMPEVTEGAIIEYAATRSSSKMMNGKEFQINYGIQRFEPYKLQRVSLTLPQERIFKTKYVRTDGPQPTMTRSDGYTTYLWEIKDVPEIIPEPDMPPWADITPRIMISSWDSWKEIYRWWKDLYRDRVAPDEDIRAKVKELIVGKKTDKEKARAIFHYVASKIRYVAVAYGEAGYRPHAATEIFANKYGDCKDQAMLLITMLKEAGIKSYPVLIGARYAGKLEEDIPMSQFNHAIVVADVGDTLSWMDPTCETCTYGDLPSGDQHRKALVFFDKEGEIITSPLQPPEKNRLLTEIRFSIRPDDSIEGETTERTLGRYNQGYRRLKYQKPALREQIAENWLNSFAPGGTLKSYSISDLEDLNVPVSFGIKYAAPNYVKKAGKSRLFKIPSVGVSAASVGKQERTYPIFWYTTDMDETVAEVQIPEGYKITYLPQDLKLDLPIAFYEHTYKTEGNTIRFHSIYKTKVQEISPEDYAEYKAFKEKLAQELRKEIILEAKE